ncbi:unnamed protein product [Symbiodinium natans]|uniref:Uncharacterized protein n=1 Tax=Symbiodinium natans TaxID=878477 RepID=A0A812UIK5_9DINO|nr:unnamed protein product [Symbiodinium natans]
MQIMGTVDALGASDLTARWLQRFWPLLHEPLAAVQLTFGTFASSHRAAAKYCLMRGVQAGLTAGLPLAGRLLPYMFFDVQTYSEAVAWRAASTSAAVVADCW